jgi:hypothetical protein
MGKNSTASACVYCGKMPVPHFINWYFESADIFLAQLRRFLVYNFLALRLKKYLRKKNFAWLLSKFFLNLGVLSVQGNAAKCKVRRAQVLWEEAEKRGIKMRELLLFGKPFDFYIASRKEFQIPNSKSNVKCQMLVFSGLPRPQNYDSAATEIMDDKLILKSKLRQAGLPVPRGGSAARISAAVKIFREIDKPVIVKPRAGSRGRHTTTYVYSEEDLRRAVKIAKQLCAWVVVEEQLFGPVYRATVIGGPSTPLGTSKLAGVLRGDPPQITGDGVHNIEQLIDIKNSKPHAGVKDIVPDRAMEIFLARQLGKSEIQNPKSETNIKSQIQNRKFGPLQRVPRAGEIINLSEKIGVNYGGSSSEDFEICHPDNQKLFLRAAGAVGDPIVGFDFIIPDITQSWKGQNCGFIEANSLPFINLHHDPLLGKPRNAAAMVWDMIGW